MVISIDGNVYTGKTYLIEKLSRDMDVVVIPEYEHDLEFMKKNCAINIQKFFLNQEYQRVEYYRKHGGTVLVDRSFLSIVAHSYAMDYLDNANVLKPLVGHIIELIKGERILLPDLMLHTVDSYEDKIDTNNKGTRELYFDVEYRKRIDAFLYIVETTFKAKTIKLRKDGELVIDLKQCTIEPITDKEERFIEMLCSIISTKGL